MISSGRTKLDKLLRWVVGPIAGVIILLGVGVVMLGVGMMALGRMMLTPFIE